MKIYLDEQALLTYMAQHKIKTYRQLCTECGIGYNTFCCGRAKSMVSKEIFWLLADRFGCHIEDLQIADWEN